MKIFYSELAENPAYYSFGYSVYGELEDGDSIEEAYEKGFLPAVVARNQPERLMYQARGVRVPTASFKRIHYHHQVARRAESLGVWEERLAPAPKAPDAALVAFVLNFFHFRFGKDSMSEERVRALFASGWVTHLREFLIDGKRAACVLEHHEDGLVHIWYHTYAKEYEKKHVGGHIYTRVIEWAKADGKKYVYIGVTFGMWMRYKVNFAPLQYWDGREWIEDRKGLLLKKLLHEGVTLIPYVDRFRAPLDPYYAPPFAPPFVRERKLIALLFDAAPRSAFIIFAVPALMLALSFLVLYLR